MKSCPPPDPNTRTPEFKPPPLACDSHCHVFGPADRFPYNPGRSYTPPDAPKENLAALHRILGLERAVIVQATCHGTDNSAMIDAIQSAPDRYRGVAIVDNTFTEATFADMHEAGIRGVRFSYARHLGGAPDFSAVRRISEIIAPLGWHVVLYLEAGDVVENAAELRSLPVPIVIDHMARIKAAEGPGQAAFQLLIDLIKGEDFWVKISCAERLTAEGPPYNDIVPFAHALLEAAPDRILWGTDWPHPNVYEGMPNDGDLVDLVPRYAPDESLREKLLVDNPARLYGFDGG